MHDHNFRLVAEDDVTRLAPIIKETLSFNLERPKNIIMIPYPSSSTRCSQIFRCIVNQLVRIFTRIFPKKILFVRLPTAFVALYVTFSPAEHSLIYQKERVPKHRRKIITNTPEQMHHCWRMSSISKGVCKLATPVPFAGLEQAPSESRQFDPTRKSA